MPNLPASNAGISPLALPPMGARLCSNLIQAPAFFVATALFGSASLAISLIEKDGAWQHRIARAWAKAGLMISGSSLEIIGGEFLQQHQTAVYVCNHLSYMDTPAIFAAMPFQFRILARSDLWKLPFIGWHLHRSGQIAVTVDNPRSSIASLNHGVRALKAGMPLFAFPEGGRARDGHLAPFMSGPSYMAIRAGVPIVPMALVGTYELLPMHGRHFRPQTIKLIVGEPVSTAGRSSREAEALTGRVREIIHDLYYLYSAMPQVELHE
ncbi:MAG: lysophospholipid acyltransferase family protein [Acidobacteriaceae bacterium]